MEGCEREKGAAALLSLCAMAGVLWLAVSLTAIVTYGARGSDEYLAETRLRLAAEGQVESLAREIEKNPEVLAAYPKGAWQAYGGEESKEGVLVTAYLRHTVTQPDEEDIFLRAWAETEEAGGKSRGKIVCGWLHRKGDVCVWRGWKPLEDPAK